MQLAMSSKLLRKTELHSCTRPSACHVAVVRVIFIVHFFLKFYNYIFSSPGIAMPKGLYFTAAVFPFIFLLLLFFNA